MHVNDLNEFFSYDNEQRWSTSSKAISSTKHDTSTTMERAYKTSRVSRPNRVWTSGGRYYTDEKPSTTSMLPGSNKYQKHVHFEQTVDQDDGAMPAPGLLPVPGRRTSVVIVRRLCLLMKVIYPPHLVICNRQATRLVPRHRLILPATRLRFLEVLHKVVLFYRPEICVSLFVSAIFCSVPNWTESYILS